MEKLSKQQQIIYDFLIKYQEDHGYPPSVRDICDAVGLRSTSTVHGHLSRLERKGLIQRDPTKPRAIEITALMEKKNDTITIPIVGRIRAGNPVVAQEEIRGYHSLPRELVRDKNSFVLDVVGDSMVEAGILNGDQIIICPDAYVMNGDIVVAMVIDDITGERLSTVKRLFKENDHYRLQPENSRMQPIFVPEVELEVLGKVIGLLRNYR